MKAIYEKIAAINSTLEEHGETNCLNADQIYWAIYDRVGICYVAVNMKSKI